MKKSKNYFITGGAGFIGAHLVNYLIDNTKSKITVYDNFDNGRLYHFGERINNPNLNIINADVKDLGRLTTSMIGSDIVYHLASNADIAAAANDPTIDFWNGTYLTHNVLEAMRINKIKRILFTSGSGVYGEVPNIPIPENYDEMVPISTYGTCKLSSEALISAYSHMFEICGTVVRFANVVGPHQTHGVAYDFIRRLSKNSNELKIFGDGKQSKPYIFIDDILSALQLLENKFNDGFDVFNVGSSDNLTVNEIANIVIDKMNLKNTTFDFTGGARGWKADVPKYKLDTTKIRSLGWDNNYNSYEAVEKAVDSMLNDVKKGNIRPSTI